jgi:hypothetical protein
MSGLVDFAATDNVYGLNIGDYVTVTGMFDDLTTGSGLETISFHEGTGNMLEFQFGSKTFNETDDWDYSSLGEVFPYMTLMDGNFYEFDFVSDFMDTGAYLDAYNFESGDWIDLQVSGDWDASTYEQSPKSLAEPGTFGLLLIGLVISLIRRKSSQPL